jgi:hypothetical protein
MIAQLRSQQDARGCTDIPILPCSMIRANACTARVSGAYRLDTKEKACVSRAR